MDQPRAGVGDDGDAVGQNIAAGPIHDAEVDDRGAIRVEGGGAVEIKRRIGGNGQRRAECAAGPIEPAGDGQRVVAGQGAAAENHVVDNGIGVQNDRRAAKDDGIIRRRGRPGRLPVSRH